MRAVVFGHGPTGCACLTELLRQEHEVAAVVACPRDRALQGALASVTETARDRGLAVYAPADPNDPALVAQVRSLAPEVVFTLAYPRLLGPDLLSIPPLGSFGLRESCLPRYRGPCPVPRVLAHGEMVTGVTLHWLTLEPDAGDVVAWQEVPVAFTDDAGSLHESLARTARGLLAGALPDIAAGTAARTPQEQAQATAFGPLRPEDSRFSWTADALGIFNLVRALTHPYGGAVTRMGSSDLRVWACYPHDASWVSAHTPGTVVQMTTSGPAVATGDGVILLLAVQVDDGPEMTGPDFAREWHLTQGDSVAGPEQGTG